MGSAADIKSSPIRPSNGQEPFKKVIDNILPSIISVALKVSFLPAWSWLMITAAAAGGDETSDIWADMDMLGYRETIEGRNLYHFFVRLSETNSRAEQRKEKYARGCVALDIMIQINNKEDKDTVSLLPPQKKTVRRQLLLLYMMMKTVAPTSINFLRP